MVMATALVEIYAILGYIYTSGVAGAVWDNMTVGIT